MKYSIPLLILSLLSGCGKSATPAPLPPTTQPTPASVKLLLDWRPEPEFGGFYAANLDNGPDATNHLNVQITTAGEGAPTWQLLATGQTDFATTAADQVLIANTQGADIIALFTVYQTCPQGVMVHAARHFNTLADVFSHPGALAAEPNAWLDFCKQKFAPISVTLTAYSGGFAPFLAQPDYSQQCFITSEPILAKRLASDPQTFLIADSGYNPYTTVLITKRQTLRIHPDLIKAMTTATRQGWQSYLDNPTPANTVMEKLNTDMDPQTFAAAAAAQKPLIESPAGLGSMTLPRWQQLRQQLIDLKVIPLIAPPADSCFTNPN